jgi:hypothetical protein
MDWNGLEWTGMDGMDGMEGMDGMDGMDGDGGAGRRVVVGYCESLNRESAVWMTGRNGGGDVRFKM